MNKRLFMRSIILLAAAGLLLFSCGSSEKFTVTGKVVDSSGAGIPGVTVSLDGNTTTTFASGTYLFSEVSQGSHTLNLSFLGAVFEPAPPIPIDVSAFTTVADFKVAWRPVKPVKTDDLQGVSFANNTFFAVGNSGVILSSTDGKAWTARTSNTTNALYGVAFSNSDNNKIYIAVGEKGTMLSSTDGITWQALTTSIPADVNFRDIVYDSAKGKFVAVGDGGNIFASSDGKTWTTATSGVTDTLYRIASLNSTFYAVGENGVILSSPDGLAWTKLNSGTQSALHGIALNSDDNTYVAVGDGATVLTSPDGTSWSLIATTIEASASLSDVAFGTTSTKITNDNNTTTITTANFVATDSAASGNVYISADGLTWQQRQINNESPQPLRRITFATAANVAAFVSVGDGGAIYWSSYPITPVTSTSQSFPE